jgi:hypothetical protein
MLASDLESCENQEMEDLNRQLDYLNYIENLAPSLQKHYGLSLDQIPTYRAEKLIDVTLLEYLHILF